MTTSTDEEEIKQNEAVSTSIVEIKKSYTQYSQHEVKYVKTINYGLIDEVVMTLKNSKTGVVDSKAVCFFNKENSKIQLVSVKPLPMPSVEEPIRIKPLFPTIVLTDEEITQTVQKDSGLKTVLKTIQTISHQYKSAIPLNVEVQNIDDQTNKYVVVLDVNGKKEQKVYTYQKESQVTHHMATTSVPSIIVPRRVVQTVVDNKKVTVSNSVDQIEVLYPETKDVIKLVKKETQNVQSVIVKKESKTTGVTFVSTSEQN